jgi:sulfate adenylyltransferase subunit 2
MIAPDHEVDALEHQSLYILREARAKISRLAMLWSMGKDSTVLLWLTRKAFFGHIPFPLIHVDTSYKIPEMIQYRDRLARELGFQLIIGQNTQALAEGMNHTRGRLVCCTALKTEALRQVIEQHKFGAIIVGIRRDEEGSRAKERVFSQRSPKSEWDTVEQPPEFWDQYRTEFPSGEHVRVHPLLHWTELDIWRYIERERIPVIDLYFTRDGRRYRSLGCAPCTASGVSDARSVSDIVAELLATKTSERSGRAQDQEHSHAMEKLRVKGYM